MCTCKRGPSCTLVCPIHKLHNPEYIVAYANKLAEEAFNRPIKVNSKEDLMLWLMSRYQQDRLGGL